MKILLDEQELEKTIADAFSHRGFQVTSINWIGEGTDRMLVINTEDALKPPTEAITPTDLAQLRDEIQALQALVVKPEQNGYKQAQPKGRFPDKDKKSSPQSLKPRVLEEKEKVEKEADLIGDPRGSKFIRAERSLGVGESVEFPK